MKKLKSFAANHYKKVAVLSTLALASVSNAALNVTEVVTDLDAMDTPINSIGAATVGVAVVMYGWRKVRGAIR